MSFNKEIKWKHTKDGFCIKQPMKVDMLLKPTQVKPNHKWIWHWITNKGWYAIQLRNQTKSNQTFSKQVRVVSSIILGQCIVMETNRWLHKKLVPHHRMQLNVLPRTPFRGRRLWLWWWWLWWWGGSYFLCRECAWSILGLTSRASACFRSKEYSVIWYQQK